MSDFWFLRNGRFDISFNGNQSKSDKKISIRINKCFFPKLYKKLCKCNKILWKYEIFCGNMFQNASKNVSKIL